MYPRRVFSNPLWVTLQWPAVRLSWVGTAARHEGRSSGHLTMACPRRPGGSASMGGTSSPSGSEQNGCQRRDLVWQEGIVAQNASQGHSLQRRESDKGRWEVGYVQEDWAGKEAFWGQQKGGKVKWTVCVVRLSLDIFTWINGFPCTWVHTEINIALSIARAWE